MVIHLGLSNKDWKTFGLPTETGIDLVYIILYYIYIFIYISNKHGDRWGHI
jgi:hypothetical protein